MKKYFKILLVICLIIIGCSISVSVFAGLVPCGEAGNPCKLCHLWQLFDNVIDFIIFQIAIPGSVLLFVISGVVLITAGGDQKKVLISKKIFTNTIIGLVIIFCSWLIIGTIINTLGGKTFEGIIGAWNKFPPCP
ncbi:pilin [Patescibacteria group bacterium]